MESQSQLLPQVAMLPPLHLPQPKPHGNDSFDLQNFIHTAAWQFNAWSGVVARHSLLY